MIDLNKLSIFSNVTVGTLILIVKKTQNDSNGFFRYCQPNDLHLTKKDMCYVLKQTRLQTHSWNFIDRQTEEIQHWIERHGVPLKELPVTIFRGITSGYNKAFFIDKQTRQTLLQHEPQVARIIYPLVRGKDVTRYGIIWAQKYILYIPWHFPLTKNEQKQLSSTNLLSHAEYAFKTQFPHLYTYFLSFKKELMGRNAEETNIRYEWYALQRFGANYASSFHETKIIWREIARQPHFTLDYGIFFTDATTFILTSSTINLKTLLLILNSKLSWFLIHLYGTRLSHTTVRYKKSYIQRLPIRLPTYQRPFEIVADYLLFLSQLQHTKWWERLPAEEKKLTLSVFQFLDDQVANPLVYELYFRELFENEQQKHKKLFLAHYIDKKVKEIDYASWCSALWNHALSDAQDEKIPSSLQQLTHSNWRLIKTVVKELKKDHRLSSYLSTLKTNTWIQKIETFYNETVPAP